MKVKTHYPDWWQNAKISISERDEVMKGLISKFSDSKLSSLRNPFFSLSKSIVGQQISVAAASAIWKRLENKYDIKKGCCFSKNDLHNLRTIGLSERKSLYLINLSKSLKNSNDFNFWKDLNDEKIFSILINFKGIGPWSIKMFLIFCLNRPDVFSIEDLGLLKAVQKNYFKGQNLDKDKIEKFSFRWKPYRTLASWFLWRSIDPETIVY